MNDYAANRLAMLGTTLGILNDPANQAIWQAAAPPIFATRVATLQTQYEAFQALAQSQSQSTTGTTADKAREEDDLETIAHRLGSAFTLYLTDKGDEASATKIRHARSTWGTMKDATLITTARELLNLMRAAFSTDETNFLAYGFTEADMQDLEKELRDFEAIVNAPDQVRSTRAAQTAQLRPKYREILQTLDWLDNYMPIIASKSPEANQFTQIYTNARQIIDRGRGPSNDDEASTLASEPQNN